MPSVRTRPFGEFVRRIFENHDYLESHSDEELLESRPAQAASARLVKLFAISPEGWKLTVVDLRLSDGLAYSIALQPQVADFVAACHGKRTLKEIADNLAAALSVDQARVRRETCNIIRQVADRGMVVM